MSGRLLPAFAILVCSTSRVLADESATAPVVCRGTADVPALIPCALTRSPALRKARHEVDAVESRRITAGRRLPSNPVLELGLAHRRTDDGRTDLDRGIDLAQSFEVGGQRGARLATADAELRAAQARAAAIEREIVSAVLGAAVTVMQAREDLRFASDETAAASMLVAVSAGREREGLGSSFDHDLAEAARIEALRRERDARRTLAGAEAALALLVGEDVRLAKDATTPPAFSPAAELPVLEEQAMATRAEVVAGIAEVEASRAQLTLLRRERIPDITIAASLRHEEFGTIVGGRLSLPLPLFRRNQGEIGEQAARTGQAEVAAGDSRLRVRMEVRAAHLAWEQTAAIFAEVPADLEPRLAADTRSLRDAYARGAMPMTALIAAMREVYAARRAVAAARLEATITSFELARAVGASLPLPARGGATR
jgi:cobalt-zinc-cadmium efflux system outer membrane protein